MGDLGCPLPAGTGSPGRQRGAQGPLARSGVPHGAAAALENPIATQAKSALLFLSTFHVFHIRFILEITFWSIKGNMLLSITG